MWDCTTIVQFSWGHTELFEYANKVKKSLASPSDFGMVKNK